MPRARAALWRSISLGKGPKPLSTGRVPRTLVGPSSSRSDMLMSNMTPPPGDLKDAKGQVKAIKAHQRPFYKKKRYIIPSALLAVVIISQVTNSGSAPTSKTVAAPVSSSLPVATQPPAPTVDPAQQKANADAEAKVVADQATADKAAADKAAADKAAAGKAAAGKAAADKAAADKAVADQAASAAAEKAAAGTVAQQNAVKKAADYLAYSSFSRTGLINQLKFEGFTTADATWGVDKQKADWNVQAAKKAKDYLAYSPFSRAGLIDQLKFDGFTAAQAAYGTSTVGL